MKKYLLITAIIGGLLISAGTNAQERMSGRKARKTEKKWDKKQAKEERKAEKKRLKEDWKGSKRRDI